MFHHAAHGNVRNNIGDKAEGHQHGQQVARAEFDGIALREERFGRNLDQPEVLLQKRRTLHKVMAARLSDLPPGLLRSITWDQGTEMARHLAISESLGAPVYFCDSHSPWQRGTNENTNGLLRQYFPKGTDLSKYPEDYLDAVAEELNDRPRKTLGYMKPSEKIIELLDAA